MKKRISFQCYNNIKFLQNFNLFSSYLEKKEKVVVCVVNISNNVIMFKFIKSSFCM